MAEITGLPKQVVVVLAQAIKYLLPFGIADVLVEAKLFTRFTANAHMLLSASTLTNL
jgi:DNA mismatch repair protein MSH3